MLQQRMARQGKLWLSSAIGKTLPPADGLSAIGMTKGIGDSRTEGNIDDLSYKTTREKHEPLQTLTSTFEASVWDRYEMPKATAKANLQDIRLLLQPR